MVLTSDGNLTSRQGRCVILLIIGFSSARKDLIENKGCKYEEANIVNSIIRPDE